MSLKTKFKRFFELEDDIVEEEMEMENEEIESGYGKGRNSHKNVVSLQSVQQSAKVILIEPRSYDEAQDIADHIKSRKSVIVNLQRIHKDQAKRIVDFLSGTVYAIGGDIQKVGSNIFLCTPDNVDVSGAITEVLQDTKE